MKLVFFLMGDRCVKGHEKNKIHQDIMFNLQSSALFFYGHYLCVFMDSVQSSLGFKTISSLSHCSHSLLVMLLVAGAVLSILTLPSLEDACSLFLTVSWVSTNDGELKDKSPDFCTHISQWEDLSMFHASLWGSPAGLNPGCPRWPLPIADLPPGPTFHSATCSHLPTKCLHADPCLRVCLG